jgi:ABC-type transport system substrate-binding protein
VIGGLLAALALALTACSDADDDASSPTSDGGVAVSVATTNPDVLVEPEVPPKPGGSLVYALASETDGYDPTVGRWATDGTQVAMAIFDPLAAYEADGSWAPYLAESFLPNEDFTEWTITLRPDVEFHDGTPLSSDAVRQVLEAHLASPLTGPTFRPVESIEVTGGLELVVRMSEPWAAFPVVLTGQAGVVPAPSQLAADDGSRNPVGTGPFRLVSWEPDKSLLVERNPDYWQIDADGQRLPYLDEIEFVPLPDESARTAAIQAGDVDMTHTVDIQAITTYREMAAAGELQLAQQQGNAEVSFVMLNTSAPPFDDPLARQVLATGTSAQAWVDVMADGQTAPADSVFRPSSGWYVADNGYPDYDPDRARELLVQYEEEHGEPLRFTFSVLATPGGAEGAQLLQSMWEELGIEVDIRQSDAGTFIFDGALGNFEATQWGQFGSPDPDYEHVWWHSESSSPVGELSLNFPRNVDPDLDAALELARSTDDVEVRRDAYATVQRRLSEDLPYVFLDYPVPVKVAQPRVRGILQDTLPGGEPSIPMGGPGSFSLVTRLTQTWVED